MLSLESSLESPFVSAIVWLIVVLVFWFCSFILVGGLFLALFHGAVSLVSLFHEAVSLASSFHRWLSLVLSFYFTGVIFGAAISWVVDWYRHCLL